MENTKRIFPSQQLVCCLDARVLKCLMWLMGWQSQGDIKVYTKQMSKFLHMDEEVVELGIQTLVDTNLISLRKQGDNWVANLNAEQIQRYFNIPMEKIKDGNGIPMATEVKWKREEKKQSSNDISDMSDDELKLLLRRIQISINEREQLRKCVVTAEPKNDDIDSLPF